MKYIEHQDIKENIVIIKINESYYEGISAEALYDYTRGIWYRIVGVFFIYSKKPE